MSDETIQLIAAAIVTMAQIYVMEPWKYPVFAAFWDFIARFLGELADACGKLSMIARQNYFTAVNSYGT